MDGNPRAVKSCALRSRRCFGTSAIQSVGRLSGCHVLHNANFQGVFLYNFLYRLSQGMPGLIFGAFLWVISASRRHSVFFLDVFECRYLIYHSANSKQSRTKPSKDCSKS